jgi:Secretion system C-terminal sorting domain
MKIKILLVCTWCFIAAFCYGQSPIKFTDTSNKWKVSWQLNGIPFPEIRTFFFNGDSIQIDGKYFQKLSFTRAGVDSNAINNSGLYFRQEGAKIYKSFSNIKPYLIYDFDLNIDSALYPNALPLTYFQKVDNIDSITLDNGSKAKRMYIVCNVDENPNPSVWIEGIGDVTNPFTPEPQCSLFDPNEFETLICFSTNGQVVYQNENFFDCSISNNIKFVSEDNQWIHKYYDGQNTYSYKSKFDFADKTVFDGKTYYALKSSNMELGTVYNNFLGYYREENGRVYIYDNGKERIKYDFNLVEGDTFAYEYAVNQWLEYRVKEVKTKTFYGNFPFTSKVITLQCLDFETYTFDWVQGAGELETGIQCAFDGINTYLSCFFQNNVLVLKTNPLEDCWTVNTDEPGLSSWEIYPNPAYDKLVVNSNVSVENVEIYTLQGTRHNASKYNDGIDISALPVGIYTVKILFGNGYIGVKKFIKAH